MEEIGIPELTEEQMETLSETAEKAARDYVQSKVPKQEISVLDIIVEAAGSRPVTISVEIDLKLSPTAKAYSAEKLVNEAAERAFEAVEEKLRELDCRSKK